MTHSKELSEMDSSDTKVVRLPDHGGFDALVDRVNTLISVSRDPATLVERINGHVRRAQASVEVWDDRDAIEAEHLAGEPEAVPLAHTAPAPADIPLVGSPTAAPEPIPGLAPSILVIGVGGAGGNAVNGMIAAGLGGVDFAVANTDAQHLSMTKASRRLQLGAALTQGLGAGARPDVGAEAAEESLPEIEGLLAGRHMVFIAAGMGGGTGTGAAPVIARAARALGILTVGVVSKPFTFEGRHRMRLANEGIAALEASLDTLLVIPNQNLFQVAGERTSFSQAFAMADSVLLNGVRSITDLILLPGLINLDFADVQAVMRQTGKAMMGSGEASGADRARAAAQMALTNPLLEKSAFTTAKAVLINVYGSAEMGLSEVDDVASAVSGAFGGDANIIFGASLDEALGDVLRVSVVATGMDATCEMSPRLVFTADAPVPEDAVADRPTTLHGGATCVQTPAGLSSGAVACRGERLGARPAEAARHDHRQAGWSLFNRSVRPLCAGAEDGLDPPAAVEIEAEYRRAFN